ncbi:MAG TPA: TolC family protein [Vicinamibacterales bacterium]|nr:TolC family protein [Vicinamibacterales bacterium]
MFVGLAIAAAVPGASGARVRAQTPPTRQLSVEEAVRLALEQNLGVRIERLNPQLQDFVIAETRSSWVPTLTSSFLGDHANTPATNIFAGGQTSIIQNEVSTGIGLSQTLPTGGNYAVAWNSDHITSTNIFNSFNPQLDSSVSLSVTQPLFKNFKIDDIRHRLQGNEADRTEADYALQAAVVQTTRAVKNAYWDLTYQIDNTNAQQQSLDLSKQLLADNERRVAAGTMASLDIVEAQSEVARNEEGVIVAEAGIRQAEDRLRVLVLDPSAPDFWTVSLTLGDQAVFQPRDIDLDGAVRHALSDRADVQTVKNTIAHDDLDVRYYKNQTLPEVDAHVSYTSNAVGGSLLSPINSFPIIGTRTIVGSQGFGSVLGDVLSSTFPTWSAGVTFAYPLGTSQSEARLARARLQSSQADLQRRNLELEVVTEVRDAARQVQTNQKRVDSAGAARELAEKRLEAEQRKYTAGVETSFFVFQAQRDLSQARTDEARAKADYNKSLADFEAVQLAPLNPR